MTTSNDAAERVTFPPPVEPPALLSSFVYAKSFLKARRRDCYRDWALDSGAYSALTSGKKIDLSAYVDFAAGLLASDPTLTTVFALDVIGDPEGTARNCEAMHRQGVPAVPTFHYGSPWHYLESMAKTHPRVAFGGLVARGKGGHGTALGPGQRSDFLAAAFGRVWPKWVHGFGCLHPTLLDRFPFAACDSTSWSYNWSRYGHIDLFTRRATFRDKSARVHQSAMRFQIDEYAKLEKRTRDRFGAVLKKAGIGPFTLRLAVEGREFFGLFGGAPIDG